MTRGSSSINWPARAPARQVCELLGELDGCVSSALLLMDTLEIALVIAELNLLLQLLAGLDKGVPRG